jgi:hypothetical protein
MAGDFMMGPPHRDLNPIAPSASSSECLTPLPPIGARISHSVLLGERVVP